MSNSTAGGRGPADIPDEGTRVAALGAQSGYAWLGETPENRG
jgi:hypothetical protein